MHEEQPKDEPKVLSNVVFTLDQGPSPLA